jgi:hypothetical protein
MVISYSRCMGDKQHAAQCQRCTRLPRNPEDEDTIAWVVPGKGLTCGKFKEAGK